MTQLLTKLLRPDCAVRKPSEAPRRGVVVRWNRVKVKNGTYDWREALHGADDCVGLRV